MRQWFINLPDTDLVYLPEGTNDFVDYVEATGWEQDLTMANRQIMLPRDGARCPLGSWFSARNGDRSVASRAGSLPAFSAAINRSRTASGSATAVLSGWA